MDEWVAFLRARLDEDEAVAKACADNDGNLGWWDSRVVASGDHTIRTDGTRTVARIRRQDVEGDFGRLLDADAVAAYIAQYDPVRALSEVILWRRILLEYAIPPGTDAVYGGTERETGFRLALSFALKAKMATYAGHPDYPQEQAASGAGTTPEGTSAP